LMDDAAAPVSEDAAVVHDFREKASDSFAQHLLMPASYVRSRIQGGTPASLVDLLGLCASAQVSLSVAAIAVFQASGLTCRMTLWRQSPRYGRWLALRSAGGPMLPGTPSTDADLGRPCAPGEAREDTFGLGGRGALVRYESRGRKDGTVVTLFREITWLPAAAVPTAAPDSRCAGACDGGAFPSVL
jgi:hypothetical protein